MASNPLASSSSSSADADSIRLLSPGVASLIAAGEVIERPQSVLRELLDNAIDAGARSVQVSLADGGVGSLEVVDDGSGMAEADLRMCTLAHATSKIRDESDLERLETLGFRGEALASIATCADLEIASCRRDQPFGWRLQVSSTGALASPHACAYGTRVLVGHLFANLPARRRFLRSTRAETMMCRRTFVEKAVAHPAIEFRLTIDGRRDMTLLAASPTERVAAAMPALARAPLHDQLQHGEVAVEVVAGRPEVARRDRSGIMIFVNNRRIQDFALVQAVDYGYAAVLPGGLHPMACVFVRLPPDRVDFNVHPAKREARFRDRTSIHQAIVRVLQRLVPQGTNRKPAPAPVGPAASGIEPLLPALAPAASLESADLRCISTATAAPTPAPGADALQPPAPDANGAMRLLGQVFGLFLVVETELGIYFVDQHAAHERVIFDRLVNGEFDMQPLLVPIELDAQGRGTDGNSLDTHWIAELARCGVAVEPYPNARDGRIVALAAALHVLPAAELIEFALGLRGSGEDLARTSLADVACKLAVKAGEVLVDSDALAIARRSFGLDLQHCPHGRPLWFVVTRTQALAAVGRG